MNRAKARAVRLGTVVFQDTGGKCSRFRGSAGASHATEEADLAGCKSRVETLF